MKFLNTNMLHNVLNGAIGLLAAALLWSGCTLNALSGAFDCSHSSINPTYTVVAIAVIVILKFVMNIMRDGFTGLVKPQPPVQKN